MVSPALTADSALRTRVKPVRIALFTASPVYYQAPLYRRLHADPRLDFTAIFATYDGARPAALGWGDVVDFDVDPLNGYRSIFLRLAHSTSMTSRGATEASPLAIRDPDIVRVLLREKYEVLWIHGYSFVSHVLAAFTQHLQRRPLIWREEQTILDPRPLWKGAVKAVALRALFSRSYALHIGTENRRWFERYGIPDERLFLAPYAVDNEILQREADALCSRRNEIRNELGVDSSKPVILTVSRLIPKKQPLFVLDAFARVRRDRPCTLLVVGTGELEAAMRDRVRQQAIPDVVFAGFRTQPQISAVYAAADIFLLFSRFNETWGLVVNEAMNFRLPIVVSDKVGSATDLVQSGKNGFVVLNDDLDELVTALGRLVDSPNLRATFGRASRQIIDGWNHDIAAEGVIKAVAAAVGADRWAHTTR